MHRPTIPPSQTLLTVLLTALLPVLGLLAGAGTAVAAEQPGDTTGPDASAASPDSSRQYRPPQEAASEDPKPWSYSLGVKLKAGDMAHPGTGLSLRPVLGLRYGRWRFGHSSGDEWLRFSAYRKDSSLEYDWRDDSRLKVSLSGRIQNLKDNESFDGFSSGRNTLRARMSMNYRLHNAWSIGLDLTQDMLNRGDGTTMTVGASYWWALDDHSSLSVNAGTTWATRDHWRTLMRDAAVPEGGWRAGLGEVGGGLSYRYSLRPHWAWFGTLSTTRTLGQVAEVSPTPLIWRGQIGLIYFSRP